MFPIYNCSSNKEKNYTQIWPLVKYWLIEIMDQMLLFFYVNIEQKYTLSIVPGYIRPLLLLSSQFYRWYCPVLLNWLYIISILIVFIFIFLEFVSKLALQIMVQHSNSIKKHAKFNRLPPNVQKMISSESEGTASVEKKKSSIKRNSSDVCSLQ